MLRDKAKEYIEYELQYGDVYNPYHYNCAETMLNAANDYYNLDLDKKTLNMITPFGGGMYTQDACGMVTGGVAVIGIIFGKNKPSDTAKLKEITRIWIEKCKEEFKGTNCRLIKDKNDIGDDESCTNLILKAADLLEDIIKVYSDDRII